MRVAIVGGGFAGLRAAYLLEQQGASVTVFERETQLGGHCRTLQHNGLFIEMGTVFSFSGQIKELLLALDIGFTERYGIREFVNDSFERVAQLSHQEARAFDEELRRLKSILATYPKAFISHGYGEAHPDLCVSLETFLSEKGFEVIGKAICPHLAAFGFGSPKDLSAFYAFSVFNLATIEAFVRGEKLLYIDQGYSEVIRKLSSQISDIRYGQGVTGIRESEECVKVHTAYGVHEFDQVLLTTVLPDGVLEAGRLADKMKSIKTNPYVSIAYKVVSQNSGTTYCLGHEGKPGQLQFFHTFRQKQKTVLVAYAYGSLTAELVNRVTEDLERCGIQVKYMVATGSWQIFPHVPLDQLTKDFYTEFQSGDMASSKIRFIGSLVKRPAIGDVYPGIY